MWNLFYLNSYLSRALDHHSVESRELFPDAIVTKSNGNSVDISTILPSKVSPTWFFLSYNHLPRWNRKDDLTLTPSWTWMGSWGKRCSPEAWLGPRCNWCRQWNRRAVAQQKKEDQGIKMSTKLNLTLWPRFVDVVSERIMSTSTVTATETATATDTVTFSVAVITFFL